MSLSLSPAMTGEVALLPDVSVTVPSLILSTDTSSQGSLPEHPSSLLLSLNDRPEKAISFSSIMFGSEGDSAKLCWTGKVSSSCVEMSEGAP